MPQNRFLIIDILRTCALALMILYHLIYDLDQWTNLNIDVNAPFWFVLGKAAALLFIFLSGISSGLSKRPVKNGLRVLFFGMIITLVTYVAFPEQYVRFGILHFLGVMMLLYPLIQKLPNSALIVGSFLLIACGFVLQDKVVNTPLLLPLGLMYPGFSTIDYYPLLPYGGVTLLGVLSYRYYFASQKAVKKVSNRNKESSTPKEKKRATYSMVTWISRHSLWIYLTHQPILLALIFGLKILKFIT